MNSVRRVRAARRYIVNVRLVDLVVQCRPSHQDFEDAASGTKWGSVAGVKLQATRVLVGLRIAEMAFGTFSVLAWGCSSRDS